MPLRHRGLHRRLASLTFAGRVRLGGTPPGGIISLSPGKLSGTDSNALANFSLSVRGKAIISFFVRG